jgi:hypothetical protein
MGKGIITNFKSVGNKKNVQGVGVVQHLNAAQY